MYIDTIGVQLGLFFKLLARLNLKHVHKMQYFLNLTKSKNLGYREFYFFYFVWYLEMLMNKKKIHNLSFFTILECFLL